jgi:hypothetical protein
MYENKQWGFLFVSFIDTNFYIKNQCRLVKKNMNQELMINFLFN